MWRVFVARFLIQVCGVIVYIVCVCVCVNVSGIYLLCEGIKVSGGGGSVRVCSWW